MDTVCKCWLSGDGLPPPERVSYANASTKPNREPGQNRPPHVFVLDNLRA